jgi:ADP-ribose pyrophosphatase
LFWATQLEFTSVAPEGTELIERVTMPLKEAVRQVIDSQITHAPTCLALMKIWFAAGSA